MKAIATVSRTKEILEKYELNAKKKFGQNFLTEPSVVERIADSIPKGTKRCAIEIGPGIGALTEQLALRCEKVIAYEIDDDLLPVLAETMAPYPHVEIRHQDFLTVDLNALVSELEKEGYTPVVCANLPYYITTPILFHLFEAEKQVSSITVMMQKEVADRFVAKPSTKDYNALTVITQYVADCKMVMKVPKEVFNPRPHVDSAVVQFTLRKYPRVAKDHGQFVELVKGCFTQRRKTIRNNFTGVVRNKDLAKELLEKAEIDPSRRSETCTLEEFLTLYEVTYHD